MSGRRLKAATSLFDAIRVRRRQTQQCSSGGGKPLPSGGGKPLPYMLVAVALAACLIGCQRGKPAAPSDPPLARLNGRALRQSQFDSYLRANQSGETLNQQARERLFRQFLVEELMLAEASRRGLAPIRPGEDPGTARTRRIKELLNQVVLSGVSVSEAEIERYYQEHPEEFRQPEQIRVREILLTNRVDAEALARRLRRDPRSFEEEARHYSQHPEQQRGRVKTYARGELPTEFERVLFALRPGSVSDVIETNYGSYVIFKVEAHEPGSLAPLDKVWNQVRLKELQASSDRLQQEFLRQAAREYHLEVLVNNLPFRPQDRDFLGKEVTEP